MEHYYKAGSMRAKPGDTDPKFGPFTVKVESANLMIEQAAGKWRWELIGFLSGGPFDSEAEAREAGAQAATAGGWTQDKAKAEADSLELAREREDRRQNCKANTCIIDWRKRHGLSQTKVAELLGSTKNTIARWERGEMRMQNPQQVALALEGAEHKGLVKSR